MACSIASFRVATKQTGVTGFWNGPLGRGADEEPP
jgi:hypothetical protein